LRFQSGLATLAVIAAPDTVRIGGKVAVYRQTDGPSKAKRAILLSFNRVAGSAKVRTWFYGGVTAVRARCLRVLI